MFLHSYSQLVKLLQQIYIKAQDKYEFMLSSQGYDAVQFGLYQHFRGTIQLSTSALKTDALNVSIPTTAALPHCMAP
jgi:hypothetical protein